MYIYIYAYTFQYVYSAYHLRSCCWYPGHDSTLNWTTDRQGSHQDGEEELCWKRCREECATDAAAHLQAAQGCGSWMPEGTFLMSKQGWCWRVTWEVGEADHCGTASSPSLDEVGLRNAAEDEGKWEVSAIVSSDRLFVSLWPEFAEALQED